jgi:hypothetical protein
MTTTDRIAVFLDFQNVDLVGRNLFESGTARGQSQSVVHAAVLVVRPTFRVKGVEDSFPPVKIINSKCS